MPGGTSEHARIYLDHNATAPLLPEVADAMMPWLLERPGNASSVHAEGRRARQAVEAARAQVAALLAADPKDILLTPSATVANNLAIRGLHARGSAADGPGRILCTQIEHPSVLSTVQSLEEAGVQVTWLGVDGEGRLDLQAVEEALGDGADVALMTAMVANNETGALLPTGDLAALCRSRGVPLHADAAQAASTLDLSSLGADLVTVSAHKIGGPKGAGALLCPRRLRFRPFITGGHQERGLVAGTENVAALVGFGVAARLARERRVEFGLRAAALRTRLEAGLSERIPGGIVNGGGSDRLPTTTNISFDDTEGETLLVSLDLAGIACSSGAACTAGSLEPSHVLLAMGLDRGRARAALRLSIGPGTTPAEIDRVLEVLPKAVDDVRRLAPNRRERA